MAASHMWGAMCWSHRFADNDGMCHWLWWDCWFIGRHGWTAFPGAWPCRSMPHRQQQEISFVQHDCLVALRLTPLEGLLESATALVLGQAAPTPKPGCRPVAALQQSPWACQVGCTGTCQEHAAPMLKCVTHAQICSDVPWQSDVWGR